MSRSIPIARQAEPEPSRAVSPALSAPEVRIGTSGWHYRSWHGPFYPARLKIKDFLSYYVQRFDTAEINNSFYRLPTEQAVQAWHDATPKQFLFAWKASRFITHMKRLKGIEESIDLVFGRMNALGDKFGPVLFQLPPTFKADAETRERVARCLSLVPQDRRCAFEFRHRAGTRRMPSGSCAITTRRSAFPIMRMRRRPGRPRRISSMCVRMAPMDAMPAATRPRPCRTGPTASKIGAGTSAASMSISTTTSRAQLPATRRPCGASWARTRASDPKVASTFGSDAPLFETRIVVCGKPGPLFRTMR
ncbi:DUF72 domain-containing protein [Microvirga sp. BT689]|nr:DUF72 domain-containing protein [Microvirga arvi]